MLLHTAIYSLVLWLSVPWLYPQPVEAVSNLKSTSVRDFGARGDGIADDAQAIQNAIDNVPNHMVYVPNGKYKLGRGLLVRQAHLKLLLGTSAILLKNSNTDMLTITADDVTIQGGVFNGRREAGFAGNGVSVRHCAGFTMIGSSVLDQAGLGLHLGDVSGFRIASNLIRGNHLTALFGERNTTNGVIEGNVIDTTNASSHSHGIAFHSTKPQTKISDLTIAGNQIRNGAVFCVEVGAFGGLAPTNITVGPDNSCEATGDTLGGFSFDSVDGGKVFQNTFNPEGHVSHAAIELVLSTDVLVSTNKIYSKGTLKTGIAVTGSHDNHLMENMITGFYRTGIRIYAAQDRPSSSSNDIEGNIVDFAAATHAAGILIQANGPSATADDNIIRDNRFDGDGQPGNAGVQLERDSSGSLDGTKIINNEFMNLEMGIDRQRSTNARIGSNTLHATGKGA